MEGNGREIGVEVWLFLWVGGQETDGVWHPAFGVWSLESGFAVRVDDGDSGRAVACRDG